jgi:hypothetical protein
MKNNSGGRVRERVEGRGKQCRKGAEKRVARREPGEVHGCAAVRTGLGMGAFLRRNIEKKNNL